MKNINIILAALAALTITSCTDIELPEKEVIEVHDTLYVQPVQKDTNFSTLSACADFPNWRTTSKYDDMTLTGKIYVADGSIFNGRRVKDMDAIEIQKLKEYYTSKGATEVIITTNNN